jgi:hypothetical protein
MGAKFSIDIVVGAEESFGAVVGDPKLWVDALGAGDSLSAE